jgi:hypothetical protein
MTVKGLQRIPVRVVWAVAIALPVLLLPQLVLVAIAPTANAALATCSAPGEYFDGANTYSSSSYIGAFATERVEQALLCSSDTSQVNGSSAWAMVATSNGYAQSGYTEFYGQGTHPFYESNVNGADYQSNLLYITYSPGQVYVFNTIRVNSGFQGGGGQCVYTTCWAMRVGSTTLGISPFCSCYFQSPYNLQFYGETHYNTTDVPGSYHYADFDNLSYLDASSYQQLALSSGSVYEYDNYSLWYKETGLNYSCPVVPGTLCFQIYDAGASPT